METVQNLVSSIIKGLVEYPEDVELHESLDSDDKGELSVINVKVNRKDVGVCIGNQGNTAEALRRIISLVGFKQTGKRIYLKIDAPKIPKDYFEYN